MSQKKDNLFTPHQRERIGGRLTALRTNRIGLRKQKSHLFPSNPSMAIFVHLMKDPVSGIPRILGYRALNGKGKTAETVTRIILIEDDLPSVWEFFCDKFLSLWKRSVRNGQGPHLFYFGERTWQGLREWDAEMEKRLSFLWFHGTDLRRLLLEHFDFPVPGRLTLFTVGHVLGLTSSEQASQCDFSVLIPESLFHGDAEPYISAEEWEKSEERRKEAVSRVEAFLALEEGVWKWASSHLEGHAAQQEWQNNSEEEHTPLASYLHFLDEEKRLQEEDILALQEYSLEERVERFRAMGPLTFSETSLDEEGRFLYHFQTSPETGLSKFREGDFLKLAPVGSPNLQSGLSVILADVDRRSNRLSVLSRQGRLVLSKRLAYSLEEDLTDWNSPKLAHMIRTVFSPDRSHPIAKLLSGDWCMEREPEKREWVQDWIRTFTPVSDLNATQKKALELPFKKRLSLIEGPPGTGKTHLLAWILIALILEAREAGRPLRMAVSALTHQAIDGVLKKVADLANRHQIKDFPARVMKWGRWKEEDSDTTGRRESSGFTGIRVEPLNGTEDLSRYPSLVLGSTGFGLYGLFEGRKGAFPQAFDWIVFDEASQILVPQTLLSLVYGKGNVLFLGDVNQLPPIVLGDYEKTALPVDVRQSILALLLDRYGAAHRIRLDETYRMNEEICSFPSRMWYEGNLRPAPANARSRLALREPHRHDLTERILDAQKPVTLVLSDHRGNHQKSEEEVEIMAQLAHRLMIEHGLSADQLALISPHRAQNNATAQRLSELLGNENTGLPLIDTVERVQGAERDVILFGLTTSDPDQVTSEFLNNPNRFNVAITRARLKLIVVGSRAFFSAIPNSEEALKANRCFKEFLRFCQEQDSLFYWDRQEA